MVSFSLGLQVTSIPFPDILGPKPEKGAGPRDGAGQAKEGDKHSTNIFVLSITRIKITFFHSPVLMALGFISLAKDPEKQTSSLGFWMTLSNLTTLSCLKTVQDNG